MDNEGKTKTFVDSNNVGTKSAVPQEEGKTKSFCEDKEESNKD